jgi:hypothetical protein
MLLDALFDRCLPVVQYIVSAIITKHSAVQSAAVMAVGTSKWIHSHATGDHNRIVRDLLSSDVIEYLRTELSAPHRKHIRRAFQLAVLEISPVWKAVAKHDLLLKCRWEEVRAVDLKKKKLRLYDEMPPLSEADAREFVKRGLDPVLSYINKCDAAADALNSKQGSKDGKKVKSYNMFLRHVTAIDMVDIILETISNTMESPMRSTSRKTNSGDRTSMRSRGSKADLLERRNSRSQLNRPLSRSDLEALGGEGGVLLRRPSVRSISSNDDGFVRRNSNASNYSVESASASVSPRPPSRTDNRSSFKKPIGSHRKVK